MAFYTYILACNSNTAIYIGAACDLRLRLDQHRSGQGGMHTARYRIRKLVYAEAHDTLAAALHREKQLKRWRRAWKDALIEKANPTWRDLSMEASFL